MNPHFHLKCLTKGMTYKKLDEMKRFGTQYHIQNQAQYFLLTFSWEKNVDSPVRQITQKVELKHDTPFDSTRNTYISITKTTHSFDNQMHDLEAINKQKNTFPLICQERTLFLSGYS